jgi:cytochrome b561
MSDVARRGVIESEIIEPEYGVAHKAFHWLVFLLLAAQYTVGSIMPHIGRNTQDAGWVHWHLLIGAAILFFVVLRLIYRFARPVPLLKMPAWQTTVANYTHISLYLLILLMCFLGWAAANYRGWHVWLFGVVQLPDLAAKNADWAHTAGDVHDVFVYIIAAVILAHMGAAYYHYFILRDRVLQRMLPH